MTTIHKSAAARVHAFLDERRGQTDHFAGSTNAPLTLSDLEAVMAQLGETPGSDKPYVLLTFEVPENPEHADIGVDVTYGSGVPSEAGAREALLVALYGMDPLSDEEIETLRKARR